MNMHKNTAQSESSMIKVVITNYRFKQPTYLREFMKAKNMFALMEKERTNPKIEIQSPSSVTTFPASLFFSWQ